MFGSVVATLGKALNVCFSLCPGLWWSDVTVVYAIIRFSTKRHERMNRLQTEF